MSHVYCPECGFLSPASANYCPRCGALLTTETGSETTMSFDLENGGEDPDETVAAALRGPASAPGPASGSSCTAPAWTATRTLGCR